MELGMAAFLFCVVLAAAVPVAAAQRPEAATLVVRAPAELSQSFIITALQDLEESNIHGKWQTPCQYAVDQARRVGGKHFSIVPTAYWSGDSTHINHYSFKDVSNAWPNGVGYPKPTVSLISRWKVGLQRCFRYAVKAGMTGIQVLNHIDNQEGKAWRNFVDFDPLKRYDGFSYEDVIVRPTADAIRTVTTSRSKVWYMFNGEMGNSLFRYPISWATLQGKYRGALQAGGNAKLIKVGIALNWNKVCGDCFPVASTKSPYSYNATYHKAFAAHRDQINAQFDIQAIRHVFKNSDVLGISNYAPMPIQGLSPRSFDMPINTCAYELAAWGINLYDLARTRPFLFSEVGLGGGLGFSALAPNLESVAANPMDGIWAVYDTHLDPWRRGDYQYYRRQWHKNLVAWLLGSGGPYWRVDASFLWSVGTWDVAAVHPVSTSQQGTFADPVVMQYLRFLSSKVPY